MVGFYFVKCNWAGFSYTYMSFKVCTEEAATKVHTRSMTYVQNDNDSNKYLGKLNSVGHMNNIAGVNMWSHHSVFAKACALRLTSSTVIGHLSVQGCQHHWCTCPNDLSVQGKQGIFQPEAMFSISDTSAHEILILCNPNSAMCTDILKGKAIFISRIFLCCRNYITHVQPSAEGSFFDQCVCDWFLASQRVEVFYYTIRFRSGKGSEVQSTQRDAV